MRKPKRLCAHRGRAISFAFIGGKVHPIHDDGRPCVPSGADLQKLLPFPRIFTPAFERPVKSGPCRWPAAPSVFLVAHRAGVARLESAGARGGQARGG